MTDDLSTVEDRLGRALGELAATTSLSPDALDRIETAVSTRRRLPATARAGFPALAVALVVVLLALVVNAGDEQPTVVAGPATEPALEGPRARYAPQGLSAYTLESAGTSGGVAPAPDASRLRVYGRRSADGIGLDAVILVVAARSEDDADMLRSTEASEGPPPPLCTASWPTGCRGAPTAELTTRGRTTPIVAIEGGFKVAWDEPGGSTVGVLTRGLPDDALAAVVEGIRLDGDDAVAATLPDGFAEVHRGIWPAQHRTLATYVSQQWWSTGSPDHRFSLMTYEGPGLSLDTRAWLFSDPAEVGQVHGKPALIALENGMQSVTWQPRPGVLLVLLASGRSRSDLQGLAETVRDVDEAEWQALMGRPHSVPSSAPGLLPSGEPAVPPGRLIAEADMPGGHWTARLLGQAEEPSAVCMATSVVAVEAQRCTEIERPGSAIGRPQQVFFEPAQGGHFLIVPVSRDVSALRYTQADGSTATMPPMGRTGSTFEVVVIHLGSNATPAVLVALDGDGREVGRRDVPQLPEPLPTAPPAMAPPAAAPPALPVPG